MEKASVADGSPFGYWMHRQDGGGHFHDRQKPCPQSGPVRSMQRVGAVQGHAGAGQISGIAWPGKQAGGIREGGLDIREYGRHGFDGPAESAGPAHG